MSFVSIIVIFQMSLLQLVKFNLKQFYKKFEYYIVYQVA